jgi:hypothetical protein
MISDANTSVCTPIGETQLWNSALTTINTYFGTSGLPRDVNIPKSLTSGFYGDVRELSI